MVCMLCVYEAVKLYQRPLFIVLLTQSAKCWTLAFTLFYLNRLTSHYCCLQKAISVHNCLTTNNHIACFKNDLPGAYACKCVHSRIYCIHCMDKPFAMYSMCSHIASMTGIFFAFFFGRRTAKKKFNILNLT